MEHWRSEQIKIKALRLAQFCVKLFQEMLEKYRNERVNQTRSEILPTVINYWKHGNFTCEPVHFKPKITVG